jgi:hypothetical protein
MLELRGFSFTPFVLFRGVRVGVGRFRWVGGESGARTPPTTITSGGRSSVWTRTRSTRWPTTTPGWHPSCPARSATSSSSAVQHNSPSLAERKRLGAARCAFVTRAVACSAASHNPRWVPAATAIACSALSPASAGVQNCARPAASLLTRPRATTSVVSDHGEVVMCSSPIDSAIQAQGVITPSIVRSSTSLGGVTRCPNRGAQRSVISLAVRDSSTPQEFVASKGAKLGNNCREVNPAVGSRHGIPPPHHVTWRHARHSSGRRPASGNHQA